EHVGISNDDFGPMLERLLQRLRNIPGLGHDLHVRLVVQQSLQTLTQQDMVVHQKATNLLLANNVLANLCEGTHRASPFSWPEKLYERRISGMDPERMDNC